jgi:cytochrome P450
VGSSETVTFPRPLTSGGLPDPLLVELTRDKPVLRVRAAGDKDVWLVSSLELVREVLSDTSRFTSMFDPGLAQYQSDMVLLDPPDHTRMRRLAAPVFSAARVQELAPAIEALVTSLLDDMEQAGPPADLVRALAVPLPANVTALVMGIPEDERAPLYQWVDPFTAGAPTVAGSPDQSDGAEIVDLYGYVSRLVAERIKNPGDDLLSGLVRARRGEDAFTEDELVATAALLIIAGQETTCKALTRGALLLTGRELGPAERFVEELLRHQSPIDTSIFRAAKVDTELGGVPIKAGEQLFVSLQLANLDPGAREAPDLFHPDRADQGHVAFGHGPHFCLGAGLARTELAIAFTALTTRFPGLRLAAAREDLTWSAGAVANAPTSLPVTW